MEVLCHRDDCFVPFCIEGLHVVVLEFDFQETSDIQNCTVCVAGLEVIVDRPCDLFPCHEPWIVAELFLTSNENPLAKIPRA